MFFDCLELDFLVVVVQCSTYSLDKGLRSCFVSLYIPHELFPIPGCPPLKYDYIRNERVCPILILQMWRHDSLSRSSKIWTHIDIS